MVPHPFHGLDTFGEYDDAIVRIVWAPCKILITQKSQQSLVTRELRWLYRFEGISKYAELSCIARSIDGIGLGKLG